MRTSIVFAFILGFVGFVTSFGAHIVAVNLPLYAKQVGIGLGMIGVLIAAYDAAEVIAKPKNRIPAPKPRLPPAKSVTFTENSLPTQSSSWRS